MFRRYKTISPGILLASKNRPKVYLFLLIIGLNITSLIPVLDSPYLGDDSWCESSIRGAVQLSNASLLDMCLSAEKDFIRSGRWYPLVIYYYPVFYYLGHYAYKLVVLLFIVLNICVFGYFVRLITSSDSVALIAVTLPPLFFQLRWYHDPILSYYFLMQLELLFLLLSLIFLVLYLRTSKKFCAIASVVTYLLCVLSYEASYTFWIMHLLVAYIHFGKSSLGKITKTVLPFLLAALANVGVSLFVRQEFGTHYDGVSLNLSLGDWFVTFLKQLLAAAPLSYFFTHHVDRFREYIWAYLSGGLVVLFVGWLVVWCFALYSADGDKPNRTANSLSPLILLGIGLWVLPALIIPFSAKYQKELTWGLGYLPVYLSVFGLMMLGTFTVESVYRLANKFNPRLQLIVMFGTALVGATVCGMTYVGNRAVIQSYNVAEGYPRETIERALHHGLMRNVPSGSCLICAHPFRSWDSPAFYRMHSGLTLQIVRPACFEPDSQLGNSRVGQAFAGLELPGLADSYDLRRHKDRETAFLGYEAQYKGIGWPVLAPVVASNHGRDQREAYVLKYEAGSERFGYAVLGRAITMKADDKSVVAASSDKVYLYVAGSPGTMCKSLYVMGSWIDHATLRASEAFHFKERKLKLISSYSQGRLYELPCGTGRYVDATSIVVSLEPPAGR